MSKRKVASTITPQIVTVLVDDGSSMSEVVNGIPKTEVTTRAVQDLVLCAQVADTDSDSGFRYLLNIAKYGSVVIPIGECVKPQQQPMSELVFSGNLGVSDCRHALSWGKQVLRTSLDRCRQIRGYQEARSPNPIVILLSDGRTISGDAKPFAVELRDIFFDGGAIDIVPVPIGAEEKHLSHMKDLASRPEFFGSIDLEDLSEFIADVASTLMRGDGAAFLDAFDR